MQVGTRNEAEAGAMAVVCLVASAVPLICMAKRQLQKVSHKGLRPLQSLFHRDVQFDCAMQASPGTQSRQARATALTEQHSVSRSKAQIRLVEKLARAQQNRAIVAESRRASRQERAKRLAQAVHIHKATTDLSEVNSTQELSL